MGADYNRVRHLYYEMQDRSVQPDVISYGCLVASHESVGEWRKALDFFDDMRRAQWTPDGKGFTSALKALVRAREWDRAKETFQEMSFYDVSATLETYNCEIKRCNAQDDWQTALNLLDDMMEASTPPTIGMLHSIMNLNTKPQRVTRKASNRGKSYKKWLQQVFLGENTIQHTPEPMTKAKYQQQFRMEIEQLRQKKRRPIRVD